MLGYFYQLNLELLLWDTVMQIGFPILITGSLLQAMVSSDDLMNVLVHVDDLIITSSSSLIEEKVIFEKVFALKDVSNFIFFSGIEVKRSESGVHLSQQKYISNLLTRTLMHQAKPLPTPMVSSVHHGNAMQDPQLCISTISHYYLTRYFICYE